jgi:transcription initiation factor TFIID subunit TAF12
MLGTSRTASGTATAGGQKFVILQSRSQTPTATNINTNISTGTIQQQQQSQQQQSQQQSQQQQQQVKLTQANIGQQKAHVQTSAPKLVVVCMSTSSHTNTVTQVSL